MALKIRYDFGGGEQDAHASIHSVSPNFRNRAVKLAVEIYQSAERRCRRKESEAARLRLSALVFANAQMLSKARTSFEAAIASAEAVAAAAKEAAATALRLRIESRTGDSSGDILKAEAEASAANGLSIKAEGAKAEAYAALESAKAEKDRLGAELIEQQRIYEANKPSRVETWTAPSGEILIAPDGSVPLAGQYAWLIANKFSGATEE